jgi:hypothetical protein
VIVFPKSYPQLQAPFAEDAILTVKGRVRIKERRGAVIGEEGVSEPTVAAAEVIPFKRPAAAASANGWHVTVQRRDQIDALARLLKASPGPVPVILHQGNAHRRMSVGIASGRSVRADLESIFSRTGVREGPVQLG